MKTLIATTLAAALMSAPALAQEDHATHHPAAEAAKPMDMSKMTPEQLHEHCAMLMGGKMQGKPKHSHTSDKMGHAPEFKAPTEAEMKAMHEKCAAMMGAKADAAPAEPAKP